MLLSDIQPLINKPVRILRQLWDESYGEPGLYAYIRSAYDDGESIVVHLDYAPFRDYNRTHESASWFANGRSPDKLITATEAGFYPTDGQETAYFEPSAECDTVTELFAEGTPPNLRLQDQLYTVIDFARRNGLVLAAERIETLF